MDFHLIGRRFEIVHGDGVDDHGEVIDGELDEAERLRASLEER